MAETITEYQKRAKDNLRTIIEVLLFENKISSNTASLLLNQLKLIPDSPFDLLADIVDKKIEMMIRGKSYLAELVLTPHIE